MKAAIGEYRNKIDDIRRSLNPEDKKVISEYERARRVNACEDKTRHYIVKLIILRDIAETPFDKWNNETIENLMIIIRDSNRAENERIALRGVLKHFLKWQEKDKLAKRVKVRNGKKPKRLSKDELPTDEESEAMFRKCQNEQERAIFTGIDETALRPIEFLNLRWSNLKIEGDVGYLKVDGTKSENSRRVIPIKASLPYFLKWKSFFKYPEVREDDYIFPSDTDRSKPYNPKYLGHLFRRLSKRAALKRTINPYMMRHRRITSVWEKTKDLRLTAKFGGHSIKVCQDTYQHSSENDIATMLLEQVYNLPEPELPKSEREAFEARIEALEGAVRKAFNSIGEIIKKVSQVQEINSNKQN